MKVHICRSQYGAGARARRRRCPLGREGKRRKRREKHARSVNRTESAEGTFNIHRFGSSNFGGTRIAARETMQSIADPEENLYEEHLQQVRGMPPAVASDWRCPLMSFLSIFALDPVSLVRVAWLHLRVALAFRSPSCSQFCGQFLYIGSWILQCELSHQLRRVSTRKNCPLGSDS